MKPILAIATAAAALFVSPVVRAEPTFSTDIAPILSHNCVPCHNPDGIGPFSLLGYEDAKRHAGMIREVVETRRMPPWHADPKYGKFRNDRSLSQQNIDTISAWVNAACPPGMTNSVPKTRPQPHTKWQIDAPSLIYALPETVTLPASGLVPYYTFEIPSGLTEDTWVSAMEVRPGNSKVVHHIVITMKTAEPLSLPHGEFLGLGYGVIGSYTPGQSPTVFDAGSAMLIPKGAVFTVQVHYTTTGKPETDRSEFAFVPVTKAPDHRVYWAAAVNIDFAIPPYAPDYEVRAERVVPQDALLYALSAHMHYRGKSFEFVAHYPTGETETLLKVPHYDFNWQTLYLLDRPVRLPKGTRIDAIAHYDNSANNPANPDPSITVRHGEQTWDEMLSGGMQVTWIDDPGGAAPKP